MTQHADTIVAGAGLAGLVATGERFWSIRANWRSPTG